MIDTADDRKPIDDEGLMALYLQWDEIALRLVLTVIAGTLVGIDRSERGQAAGLRTTILVCLAASRGEYNRCPEAWPSPRRNFMLSTGFARTIPARRAGPHTHEHLHLV